MRRSIWFLLVAALLVPTPLKAQPDTKIQVGPDQRVRVYKLESVELHGTTRMSVEDVVTELGLAKGAPLNDELVMMARSRLLGLGVFRSVILLMRKGQSQGWAKLIIEVEDDSGVLTDWAIGGELGVTLTDSGTSAVDTDSTPLDYRLGIVGRNVFRDLHRGAITVDVDSTGKFQAGQLAYGLPRFTAEDVQFDAEIAASSPQTRYLDTLGFGQRAQGLWSQSVSGTSELGYGAAMYINQEPRFAMPGFPKSVAGPKISYHNETRLRGFFPTAGHKFGANLLLAPTNTDFSTFEINLAQTLSFGDLLYFTVDARSMLIGSHGFGFRSEGRFDIPLGKPLAGQDQAELFLLFRGGRDQIDKTSLVGSAAVIGVRYHSSGFIAEFALKVTRSPEALNPADFGGASQ